MSGATKSEWCVVAVQLCHVHDGQARCPAENK